ncbi:MAG: response regulator [Thiogranum sp.]|nr:response regulator [Thiogranum sp.]
MDKAPDRILIVDDDPDLCKLLQRYLSEQGFVVTGARDAAAMDASLASAVPDLLILDLMLPGEDGLSIARRLRSSHPALPILMLSARGDEVDRIVGLEVGADDYLAKPFNPRELLARIRAVLRRGRGLPRDGETADEPVRRFGPYRLNLANQELRCGDQAVPLTSSEFALLKIFVEHPRRVLSRDRLLDLLKGYERSPYDRSIDVRVTRLRRKIEKDASEPVYIRTVWGEGYRFCPDDGTDTQ